MKDNEHSLLNGNDFDCIRNVTFEPRKTQSALRLYRQIPGQEL
jgi:hypothetical protein